MSSNKNRDDRINKYNVNKNANTKNENKSDEDIEKSDGTIEQTGKMEQKVQDVKKLLQSDKEAIRKMQEERIKSDDDMDYLDDEKSEDDLNDKQEERTEEKDNHNATADTRKKNKKGKNNKRANEKSRRKSQRNDNQRNENNKHDGNRDSVIREESHGEESESNDEEDVRLDFFASLDRDREKENTGIRKKQPNRLRGSRQSWSVDKLKDILLENKRNFYIGTAIAVLFMVLFVALALDAGKANKESKNSVDTEFLKIDTTPMIDTINNYYAALAGDDVNLVRSFLMDSEKVTDEEIKRKSEETKVYADLISSSFLITDCYVQQGLNDNEYIAYMKFQLQIKSIETPAVGIFTCYIFDVSKDGNTDYKIGINVNDKSTEVYKYMAKMRNCSNVTKLFDDVNKELEEACSKDENLRAVVEALRSTEQSSEENIQAADDSTTVPMENVD